MQYSLEFMGIEVATSKTLCDCGSGLLFSECHMLLNLPKESFLVNITAVNKSFKHMTRDKDGNEREMDGIIEMELTFGDPQPWDAEISEIIKLSQTIPNNDKVFEKRTGKLRHKLDALKYHSTNFTKEEDRLIHEYQTAYTAENINYALENPTLIYNTESFLFQTKSCLDVLSQIIAIAFNLSVRTYKNNGNDLVNKIRNSPLKGYPDQCADMIELIKRNKPWITLAVKMRDQVTHYSDLIGLSCFRYRAWKGEDKARIYYPSLPNRERVSKFMDETWNNLMKLIRETHGIIKSIYSAGSKALEH